MAVINVDFNKNPLTKQMTLKEFSNSDIASKVGTLDLDKCFECGCEEIIFTEGLGYDINVEQNCTIKIIKCANCHKVLLIDAVYHK